jgi:NADPH-dependent 2,4-dienoyl-CoA reductase/sulfur reductase-like enzyme
LVNPRACYETELIFKEAQPKNIAVIGAGPAGLSFATYAAVVDIKLKFLMPVIRLVVSLILLKPFLAKKNFTKPCAISNVKLNYNRILNWC